MTISALYSWFPMRQKSLYLLAVAILLVFIILKLPFYSGDGRLRSNGWLRLGYRYELAFDTFLFKGEQVHKIYKFSGVPREKYGFQLNVLSELPSNKTITQFEPIIRALDSSTVEVEVKLLSNGDNYIHIEQSPFAYHWVASYWHFWHQEFDSVRLFKRAQYELQITITSNESFSESVTFQPMLVGGHRNVF